MAGEEGKVKGCVKKERGERGQRGVMGKLEKKVKLVNKKREIH